MIIKILSLLENRLKTRSDKFANFISTFTNISGDRLYYVLINILISGLGFTRSFIFMKLFDFKALGIITLVQTIILFLSIMQIGLINGGYRVISINSSKSVETNNIIYSYIGTITLISLCLYFLSLFTKLQIGADYYWVMLSFFAGLLALTKNWINNFLIAKIDLKLLNKINLWSNLSAMLPLLVITVFGVWAGILSIIIQPLIFVTVSLIIKKELRPNGFDLNLKSIKWLLSFGFIPFLTGVFEQFNLQIERWGITYFLNVETLGKFFLPTFFASLFIIIPASVNNLFFPKAMKYYVKREFKEFRELLKKYYLFIGIYSIMIVLVVLFSLQPLVSILFPQHLPFVKLVYFIIPGSIALQLIAPIGLIFNASMKLKPMLLSYLVSLFLNLLIVLTFGKFLELSLDFFAILRTCMGITILLGYWIGYNIYNKEIWSEYET